MTSTHLTAPAGQIRQGVAAFFASYCRTFEARDIETLSTFFLYPILLTNAEAEQQVLQSPADYIAVVQPLITAYRRLGAERGKVLDIEVVRLAPSLAIAVVDWEVAAADDRPLYRHRASYTLVSNNLVLNGSWRIAAMAVDEAPKLQQALRA